MTKNKQFKSVEEKRVWGAVQYFTYNDGIMTNQEIEDLVNQLLEENEQLKLEYKILHTQYQDLKKFVENNFDEYLTQEKLNRQIIKLSDDNEQLKQQMQRLYNYFADWFYDEMPPSGFSEMWDFVKEDEKLNELCVKYGFEMGKLEEENEQLKEKNKKNIQFVFKAIEMYSADCFDHNEGGWSYMLNDLIEYLKDGMDIVDGDIYD